MPRLLAICLGLLLLLPAASPAADGFARWKERFAAKLRRQGFAQPAVELFLANAYYVGKPIAAQKRQPEKITRFDDYRRLLLTAERIADGRAYLRDHRPFYAEMATRYQLEPQLLVALWGIESSYGKIMGKHPIIPSLASLAYAGRRREFFEKQLVAAVRIAARGEMPVERMTGSWAGAMGHYQFIPTTFEAFAVDGDGDSRRDLCGSYADAAASAGNYLHELGWQPGDGRIIAVDGPKGSRLLAREGKKGTYRPAAHWQAAGLLPAGYPDSAARLKLVGADDGRSGCYLVGEGFDRLKEWNRSTYFALAVLLLADQLAAPH
ncbi:MAG: lytic murein transglycosylase [Deltaproteobacteria bacterium]|nr:MAG: lytic murein transglycosylase [Deltaproteobacteria bacterium]